MGEFSFVLADIGRSNGLLGEDTFLLVITVTLTTIFLTPFLVRLSPYVAGRVEKLSYWIWRGVRGKKQEEEERRAD